MIYMIEKDGKDYVISLSNKYHKVVVIGNSCFCSTLGSKKKKPHWALNADSEEELIKMLLDDSRMFVEELMDDSLLLVYAGVTDQVINCEFMKNSKGKKVLFSKTQDGWIWKILNEQDGYMKPTLLECLSCFFHDFTYNHQW